MEWFKESWGYLVLILGLVVTGFKLIQTTYAAQRDRQALANSELEREKLALEVEHLKNRPEIVKERRAIYDRLDSTVREITRDAKVSMDQINALHRVRLDAEFRFPADVVERIVSLIHATVDFDVTNRVLEYSGILTPEGRKKQVEINHVAATAILKFETDLVDIFRPHLKL
jgi:hypothetical protein